VIVAKFLWVFAPEVESLRFVLSQQAQNPLRLVLLSIPSDIADLRTLQNREENFRCLK
jgi:hypothetical protein